MNGKTIEEYRKTLLGSVVSNGKLERLALADYEDQFLAASDGRVDHVAL